MSTLRLSVIFEYARCTPASRNYIEGEKILNSKHLILCGKLEQELRI